MQNIDRQPKLTISLLVSNRKDTVPKCLDSLRPLLEHVDSELIITDTGCDEDLVTYMKKYTGNIIKFTWCSDFAAARNVGLKMAKGKWFMYIDDDEWFENVDELVDFFNSDEEEKYTSASYVVRNYISMKGEAYSEGVVGRIFRIEDGMEFVGKVHEQIKRPEGLEKQFVSFVHHYGYVFENEEKRIAHFERNTKLLNNEIEEYPGVARNYAHIYQEYKVMGDADKALEYAFKALENVKLDTRENKVALCSTYVCFAWAYNAKKEYDKTVEWGERFLKDKPITFLTKAAMMSYMAEAYLRCGIFDKAIECTEEYIKLSDMFKCNRERYYQELGPLLNDTFKDTRSGMAISSGLQAAIKLNNLSKANEYILAYDWSQNIYMVETECLSDYVKLLSKLDNMGTNSLCKYSVRALGKIFTNVVTSNIALKAIGELKSIDEKGYLNICSIMSLITGQKGYNELVAILNADRNNDIDKLNILYKKVICVDGLLFYMEKEFFEIAFKKNISLGQLISSIDMNVWSSSVREWASISRNLKIIEVKKYIDGIKDLHKEYRDTFEEELIKELENRKK